MIWVEVSGQERRDAYKPKSLNCLGIVYDQLMVSHDESCQSHIMEDNMYIFSIFYPNIEGKRFDLEYYCRKHMTMAQEKLGAACKGISVEWGVCGGIDLDSRPTYLAIGHVYFDSMEAFQAAFKLNAQEFTEDMSNYTDIQPITQICEVKM